MTNKRGGRAGKQKHTGPQLQGVSKVDGSGRSALPTAPTAPATINPAGTPSAGAGSVTGTNRSNRATGGSTSTARGAEAGVKAALSQEAKRDARMQRQSIARAAAERHRRMQFFLRFGILAILVLAAVGGGIAWYMGEAGKPGEGVGQQTSFHLADITTPHEAYSNDPPTSGPHVKIIAAWGVSVTPIAKEKEVHNLEDGGVVISYRPDLDQATVDRLAELARSYSTQVLMAPYPGLSSSIALTAWNRVDRLTSFDEARIKRFVEAFRGKDHHVESGG